MQGTALLSWMAWTWPTAAFFVGIALALLAMTVWEIRSPGGAPRRGALGLETTRGDRLFISLLGSAFIFLAWLGVMGTPLWGAGALSALYAGAVFRWACGASWYSPLDPTGLSRNSSAARSGSTPNGRTAQKGKR